MRLKSLFTVVCLVIQLTAIPDLLADVKLPKILTDNMVLQRDEPVKVWGRADSGEKVTVVFNGQERSTKADKKGRWLVKLEPMNFGGPFEMRISGKKNSIVLANILIGDVWIGSGQSNMSWKLLDTNNAEEEISAANYPEIRLFTVERLMAPSPQDDLSGGPWKVCTPENAEAFSAVAYYFGKNLHQELGVPVGLINTSWGGTNIEAWSRLENLVQFEEYKKYKEIKPAKATQTEEEREQAWSSYRAALDNDKGLAEKWFEPTADISGWKTMNLPLGFDDSELGEANGIVWFSIDIEVPAGLAGESAQLSLGVIDDKDETYVNGVSVGSTGVWNKKRVYEIPADLLKPGKNRITVKVTDNASLGGIRGEASDLYLTGGGQKISLAGDWKYKPSALSTDYNIQNISPNVYPSQLYNAMIAPLHNLAIKGAIWYQGESNARNGYRYGSLFPAMVTDWREKWGKDFPFIWVQLANYMMPAEQPGESEWADLREAQSKTLALPNTGQAVIIDIGEEGDIHPKNKKDVGQRLALAALKTAYNKDVVYSGPVFKSMTTDGNKAILSFDNTGGGLEARDKFGYLKEFAIAGEDRKFVWAKAYIEGDKVVVYSDQVKNPVAVRYAWADNPDQANLYNKEGLPASPFRTDNWETITQKNQKM